MSKLPESLNSILADLTELNYSSFVEAIQTVCTSKDFHEMDRLTLIEQLFTPVCEEKLNKRFNNRVNRAHLKGCPQTVDECVDSNERIYLPNGITSTLANMDFISEGLNVCILGPSDSGKSYLAKAIGVIACSKYIVSYNHCETFLEEMVSLKESNYKQYQKKVKHYIKVDLLILDDFLLHTITDEREIKVLFEIMEKRSEAQHSTIVCSQREPKSWAAMILKDEVSSNAIMKRATKHYTVVIQPQNND